ncbi:ATP-binding cassette domain-containing protein [Alicyclobacillus sendaiensis]|uniref:ATP-binding cassette domain-containing protein n=1 Tax=Alicyclobacillus sendaiensis TaxID=192387 RepID=UPI0009F9BCCA|nr:ABC transporter ATP-binding protein [Alicyclobacillus sendaiensis]
MRSFNDKTANKSRQGFLRPRVQPTSVDKTQRYSNRCEVRRSFGRRRADVLEGFSRLIEILHVDKRVRTSWILRNAHATLAPGLTVVVGANGSGKSTLLRCMVGQWRPTRGEIRVNGKPANRLGYEAGVLLDPPGFYEHLTAKEMLAYYVRLCGRKWSARHEELLHRFGVPQGRIRGFSRGQRQKLGILCSVWHEPEIWVLDEPFTGLDGYGLSYCGRRSPER